METDAPSGGLRPRLDGAITFDNVTFTYGGTKTPALNGVTFSIPAGTMLGIVGRSGSGKSTITRLLQGINRDYSGFLKLDGSDLREINLRHLRQSSAWCCRRTSCSALDPRQHHRGGSRVTTLADAVHASRLAGAEEFIERLPNGYETYIEEGSPNLSGGQRQRIAIARALIHDPRVVIMDEATSALDPESEAVVNANLLRIARGRTMVIVSPPVIPRGLRPDPGDGTGQGRGYRSHEELVERCLTYRQLEPAEPPYRTQEEGSRHAAA
jgi:ATP-binding cassette subfamily B protein